MAQARASKTIVGCQIAYAGLSGTPLTRVPDYVGCHAGLLLSVGHGRWLHLATSGPQEFRVRTNLVAHERLSGSSCDRPSATAIPEGDPKALPGVSCGCSN